MTMTVGLSFWSRVMSLEIPLESFLLTKCLALGSTCTSNWSSEMSMPTNTSSYMCSVPTLWMRAPDWAPATVRASYTRHSAIQLPARSQGTKDRTIYRGPHLSPAKRRADVYSPYYQTVPLLTTKSTFTPLSRKYPSLAQCPGTNTPHPGPGLGPSTSRSNIQGPASCRSFAFP